MKLEPLSVALGFAVCLVLLKAKQLLEQRKEGYVSCGRAV